MVCLPQLPPDSPLHAMFFLFLFRKQPTAMTTMMIKIYRKSRNLQNVSKTKLPPQMRQKSTEIPLNLFYVGPRLLDVEPTFKYN